MKEHLAQILVQEFTPSFISIQDDSHKHASHNPAAKNGGTHFSITIRAHCFMGVSKVNQHKMVYKFLDAYLKDGLHALQLNTGSD